MNSERKKGYSTLDVAKLLGVTVQTVQRWVDAGHLDCWRTVGGHRRIDADSVHRFREVSGMLRGAAATPALAVAANASAFSSNHLPSVASALIVDDDPADRELVAYLLRRLRPDWRIEFAENGFAALLAIGRAPPTVLITDVAMPYLNGAVMLRSIVGSPDLREVAVLALSSHSAQEISQLGGLPSGVAFLPKPLDRGALGKFLDSLNPNGVRHPPAVQPASRPTHSSPQDPSPIELSPLDPSPQDQGSRHE